jgi:drug/metabolite transporter (DMT)-like permease
VTPRWTVAALVAFAANSLLCRLALGPALIDAASFTTIRLASGAALLLAITSAVSRPQRKPARASALALFAYAIAFSYAYLTLSAGTGALLLFGAVQTTMLVIALARGERPRTLEWLGLATAMGGLLYLLSPGITAPPFGGALLMIAAGAAWGVYSVLGRRAVNPAADTAVNFARAWPFAVAVSVATVPSLHVSLSGALLAALSGAVTSGLGYVAWYAALPHLSATRAAIVQLAVPVLAAAGGVLLLDETVTNRMAVAAVLVLGGIGLAIASRSASRRRS